MKAFFTRRAGVAICLLLMTGLPWSCVDHVQPTVTVTCSCQIIDNSGPTSQYQTKTMECPTKDFTCTCGGIAQRGGIVDFHCN